MQTAMRDVSNVDELVAELQDAYNTRREEWYVLDGRVWHVYWIRDFFEIRTDDFKGWWTEEDGYNVDCREYTRDAFYTALREFIDRIETSE